MAESHQKKIERVRRPRVQISYDVEDNGAMVQKELPFVVGVLAGLSGHRPEVELGKLKDRSFTLIDRDNIDKVLADAAPVLNISVPNTLSGDGTNLRMQLKFDKLTDFEPGQVVTQVAPLNELLKMRKQLDEVLARINTNEELENSLQALLANQTKVQELAKQMGIDAAKPEGGK